MKSLFRIYYLFNGPKIKLIKEETVFKSLIYSAPLASGLFTTMYLAENVSVHGLGSPQGLFFFSYCAKTPFHADFVPDSIIFLAFGIECIACLVSAMVCHLVILVKQARIDSRADVYVLKNNMVVSGQRHHRNVVSFTGHFVSFILTIAQFTLMLNTFYFFVEAKEVLATMRNLVQFFFPATEFLIYPLIETICSESLIGTFRRTS